MSNLVSMNWNLQGFDKVSAKLQALPPEMRGKPARSALGSAVRLITKQAKSNVVRIDDPETGRDIADNIVQRFRSRYFKQTGDLMISVGVATEKGRIPPGNPDTGPKGNTPHWHLIELGTERARAQPFLRPALASTLDRVQTVFADRLSKAIDKAAKK